MNKRTAKPKPIDLGELLILAIEKSAKSTYLLAKESGVSASVIGRFIRKERDLTLSTASKLAQAVGLRVH
jgi:plasmid maintenance system antidote protein VapI